MDNIEEDFIQRKHILCIIDSTTSVGSKVTGAADDFHFTKR